MPAYSFGPRVIVLGAGATRGSKFADDFETGCKPPLNADFFTQLQRITEPKYKRLVREVIDDVVSLFGSNFSLTLEDYFTQLEFLAEAVELSPGKGGALSLSELRAKRARLMHAVSAVLEVSTDAAIRRSAGCSLHEDLVGSLRAGDTILSFNYDCVLDHALRQHGDGKWSAKYGYAFPNPARVIGPATWDPDQPARSSKKTVFLMKLHGSLNWQFQKVQRGMAEKDRPIKLKQRLHGQNGAPRFDVIPPVWNKALGDPVFEALWRQAERAIRNAREIAVVGFSFATTDLPVESLFRVALAKSAPQTLVIANPSREDRHRVREVFAKPLEGGTIVRQYSDFERFVDVFPGCFG